MQLPAHKLTEGNRNAVAKVANMASLEEQRRLLGEIKLRFGRVCHGGGVVCVGGGFEAGHICRPDMKIPGWLFTVEFIKYPREYFH